MMQHTPHLFVMHQQQMLMRQQQQQHNHSHSHGHNHDHSHGVNSPYIPPELSSAVSQLLSNPEAKEKLQTLAVKIESQKSNIKSEVQNWDEMKRKEYFENTLNIPLLESFSSMGDNPLGRMERLMNMNEEEMTALITLQTVLEYDRLQGGKLSDQFLQMNTRDSNNSSQIGTNANVKSANTVWGLMSALGSSTMAGSTSMPPIQHSHIHDHAHGQSCNAHHIQPALTPGQSDKMER